MARKRQRQRDRRTPRVGMEWLSAPAEPIIYTPNPGGDFPSQDAALPGAGLDQGEPPAPGSVPTVTALSQAASAVADGATPEAVTRLRAELVRTLATALDLATEAGDVDQMLKVTDRLTKLLPAGSAAPPATPPEGGDSDGPHDTGAPSAAERFRLLSGELGD